MRYALTGARLLDGTETMEPREGLCVLVDGETITDIVPAAACPSGYETVDLSGKYLLPGRLTCMFTLPETG